MAEWTVVTGATGFVGGEWTLRALLRGESVATLVRPGREQDVIPALIQLAQRHGWTPPSFENLVIVPWKPGHEAESFESMRALGVGHVRAAIHAAADMTYALPKLPRSLENNLGMSLNLYNAVARYAPEARKFISVSTAYSCGLGVVSEIPESLHLTPKLVNAYQTSKWATEMVLSTRAQQGNGPQLAILRPTIVVGESGSGIYTGKCFGVYMFLKAFALARKAGAKNIRVAINPQAEINLLPIDNLVTVVNRLRENSVEGFVHAAIDRGAVVGELIEHINETFGMNVVYGKPQNMIERFFDRQVSSNMAFANTTFKFHNSTVKNIAPEHEWEKLPHDTVSKIVRQSKELYFQSSRFKLADFNFIPQLIPMPVRKAFRYSSLEK